MMDKISLSHSLSRPKKEVIVAAKEGSHAFTIAQKHVERVLESIKKRKQERSWAKHVASELNVARSFITQHRKEMEATTGLFHEIETEAVHLTPKIQGLKAELTAIELRAAKLSQEVDRVDNADSDKVEELKHLALKLIEKLKDAMSKETDLVFESFKDTPALD